MTKRDSTEQFRAPFVLKISSIAWILHRYKFSQLVMCNNSLSARDLRRLTFLILFKTLVT